MQLTREQFDQIAPLLPRQRGNVRLDNFDVVNAILFVAANGCKWRALPSHYGPWHSVYTRMSRWAKAGVLDIVFSHLQKQRLMQVRIEAVSLDSTIMKVHPDGTGAQKKRTPVHWQEPGRVDHQASSGCRECLRCCDVESDAGAGGRWAGGAQADRGDGRAAGGGG